MDARDTALAAVYSAFRSDVQKLFVTLVNGLAVATDEDATPAQAAAAFRLGFEQSTHALEVACATIDSVLPPPA